MKCIHVHRIIPYEAIIILNSTSSSAFPVTLMINESRFDLRPPSSGLGRTDTLYGPYIMPLNF